MTAKRLMKVKIYLKSGNVIETDATQEAAIKVERELWDALALNRKAAAFNLGNALVHPDAWEALTFFPDDNSKEGPFR